MSAYAAVAAPTRPLRPALLDALRDLAHWLADNSTGARLLAETRRLEALSDAELARHGLDRADIVRHVFAYHGA